MPVKKLKEFLDGNNISDLFGNRPGIIVNYERNVISPFILAGLESEDIIKAIERSVPLAKTRKKDIDYMRDWANENAVRASVNSTSAVKSEPKEIGVGRNIDF